MMLAVGSEPTVNGGGWMRDWVADWRRWSRAERCFAIVLLVMALALPLGLLIGARIGI
jgi:hypothetical protein